MRSRPSGSELALRNRGIATGALRRSCSHSSRHFEPRYYREQKEESQCIWTRSEAVLEKELWIIFFSRYVAQDPMLTGILQVGTLPPQCTFWRFLTSLPVTVAQQLLKLQRLLRERVWEAANVRLPSITLDTDTTVHTLYGRQMGARKSWSETLERAHGGRRRRRVPEDNASFRTQPKVGGRPIGSSLCAT